MKESLLDVILMRDARKTRKILKLIDEKRYQAVIDAANETPNFTIVHESNLKKIRERLELEVINYPTLVAKMYNSSFPDREHYFDLLVDVNKEEAFRLILETSSFYSDDRRSLLTKCIEAGYNPMEYKEPIDFLLQCDSSMINMLLDKGIEIPREYLESKHRFPFLRDPKLVKRLVDGNNLKLNKDMIIENGLYRKLEYFEDAASLIDIGNLDPHSSIFKNNSYAIRKALKANPEIIEKISARESDLELLKCFLREGTKLDILPKRYLEFDKDLGWSDYSVFTDESMLKTLIQYNPRYCIYNRVINREPIYKYAISLGYEPTIEDFNKPESCFWLSEVIMSELLKTHPELLPRCDDKIMEEVAPIAIQHGFIPTREMVEKNRKLLSNYDVMKALIEKDPSAIELVSYTDQSEKLLELAISLGYNGELIPDDPEKLRGSLLSTELGIVYELKRTGNIPKIVFELGRIPECGPKLYNELIKNGFNPLEYAEFFNSNYEVLRNLVEVDPSIVSKIPGYTSFSPEQVDLLCLRAMELGYEPKYEDEIFGRGYEVTKYMLKKDPSFIKQTRLLMPTGFLTANPNKNYQEFVDIAYEGGYRPTIQEYELTEVSDSAGYRYNFSFCFSEKLMAHLVDISPSLIEEAQIEDPAAYDRLCSLALSKGYTPDVHAKYELKRKLCKSPTMLRYFLDYDPDVIEMMSIDDSIESLKLLRLAKEKGYNFKNMSQGYIPRIFSNLSAEDRKEFLADDQLKILEVYDEQKRLNDDANSLLDYRFAADYYKNLFSKEQYEVLSNYRFIQAQFVSLEQGGFIESFMIELIDKYSNDLSWVTILKNALDNYAKPETKMLFSSIDISTIFDEDKESLENILINGNKFNITSFEELKRFREIREEYLEKLELDPSIICKKTLYLEKMYGIDYEKAISLVEMYGLSLDSTEFEKLSDSDKETFKPLLDIKRIVEMDNMEELNALITTIPSTYKAKTAMILDLESDMKNIFLHKLNETFYNPDNENEVERVDNIPVYLAAGEDGSKEFRMMMTSLGAYTSMQAPDDFCRSFNMPKTLTHHCCCSFLGNQSIGTARIKYTCLGFSDYSDGMLALSSTTDLGSNSSYYDAQIVSKIKPTFLLPEDLLNSTRHTHNESTFERRDLGKGEHFKKQPTYVVYHCDNLEDRETNLEDMKRWEYAVKCSKDFEKIIGHPLPIVVVEREKVAQVQASRIYSDLEKFKETYEPSLISDIITRFESNYAGNREYHTNIGNKYFPKSEKIGSTIPGKIERVILKLAENDPIKARELLSELKEAVLKEKKRYFIIKYQDTSKFSSFNIDVMLSMIEEDFKLIERKIKGEDVNLEKFEIDETTTSLLETLSQIPITSKDYEEFYSILGENYDVDQVNALLSSKYTDLIKYVDSYIDEKKLNINDKAHSPRHIKDVALFSLLIGRDLPKDKLNILIQSAMYHDSGRTNDGSSKHSEASAIKAGKDLIEYKDKGLGIIQIIIDFHEVSRSIPRSEQDRIFNEMYEKYASDSDKKMYSIEEIRELAEMLKDADALDRTRFYRRGAMLNPELLVYPESKKLMKFACSIQEKYALDDLKKYFDSETVNKYISAESPKRIIKIIRTLENQGYTIEQIKANLDNSIVNLENLQEKGSGNRR